MAGPSPAMTIDVAAPSARPGTTELRLEFHARDGLEVAVPDLFLVRLRHVDAFENAQRFARIHRALLRIERAIGREYDLVGVIESESRMRCRHAAKHGGVRIE